MKVSIILCTYNRPKYFKEALDSILQQTYEDLEIVIVRDGGEPVNQVVSQAQASGRAIQFVDRGVNRGIGYSMQEGLLAASGDFVGYLGDDDKFYPNHVEVLVNALKRSPEYYAAYSDLYKVICRIEPDESRTVLAKNVDISRDYNREAMLRFNHILQVSLLHSRVLAFHVGGFNQDINVLYDYDLIRRLAFYTDFKHVPIVTGEWYAPREPAPKHIERVSVRGRVDAAEYMKNVMTIYSRRPQKPWPKMPDIGIIWLGKEGGRPFQEDLLRIWSQTYYPRKIYCPFPRNILDKMKTSMPDVYSVEVDELWNNDDRFYTCMNKMEPCDYVAVIPEGWKWTQNDAGWLMNPVYASIKNHDPNTIFCTERSQANMFIPILPYSIAMDITNKKEGLLRRLLRMKTRKPARADMPCQYDYNFSQILEWEKEGYWSGVIALLHHMNILHKPFYRRRLANAYYHAGQINSALGILQPLNRDYPTPGGLLLEARIYKETGLMQKAIQKYKSAETILQGK